MPKIPKEGSAGFCAARDKEEGRFYAGGLRFSCKRCSACCRFEAGFVFLSEKDASLLASALKMSLLEFIAAYCRWVYGESGKLQLSLKEKSNFDCVFWNPEEGGICGVYDARPLQCRTFPFWPSVVDGKDSWEMTARDCPGMGEGILHSRGSIEKYLAMRQAEPIISKDA